MRNQPGGTLWFAVAIGLSAFATMVGNAIAPAIARRIREETDALGALGLSAVSGIIAAVLSGSSPAPSWRRCSTWPAPSDGWPSRASSSATRPQANRGRAFAHFETHFQFGWAVAGVIPVIVVIPGPIGFLVVGLVSAAGFFNYAADAVDGPATLAAAATLRRRRPGQPSLTGGCSSRASHSPGASSSLGVGIASGRRKSGASPVSPARSTTPCTNRLPRAT